MAYQLFTWPAVLRNSEYAEKLSKSRVSPLILAAEAGAELTFQAILESTVMDVDVNAIKAVDQQP